MSIIIIIITHLFPVEFMLQHVHPGLGHHQTDPEAGSMGNQAQTICCGLLSWADA
jgi:hypothetical protein